MEPPPISNPSWKPVTRYGVLVKRPNGDFIVWGPRKLRNDAVEMAALDESCLADLGEVLGVVEIANWQEIYTRSYEARASNDNS